VLILQECVIKIKKKIKTPTKPTMTGQTLKAKNNIVFNIANAIKTKT
jgi:hypothetical protein